MAFVRSVFGVVPALALIAACGGKVVFVEDGDGGGGEGASGPTSGATGTTNTTSATTSATTGTNGGPGLVEEQLGQGVSAGSFQAAVTPGTLGLTLVVSSSDSFDEIEIWRTTAPSGTVIYDEILPTNSFEWLWYGDVAQATPQLSHAETFPLAQGTWTWDVIASAPLDVSVWRRSTADGAFYGGVLDVNVYVAGGFVPEDEVLDLVMESYGDWAELGLGEVRFFPLGDQYVVVDDGNLFDLLAETQVAPTVPVLNVMLVAGIEGSLEGAAGFSMGVPGGGVAPGSNQSAVVWMYIGDGFFDPIILRHEAGHYAGLFHTSEFVAGLGDPITDTPFCDDVLSIGESCPDYDYIMFPSGGSGLALFSPLQKQVIHGGSLYRGAYAAGEPPMPPYAVATLDGESQGRRVTVAEKVASAARRAGSVRVRDANAAWAAGLPAGAARELEGIGCPHGAAASYYDTLASLGATDAGTMIAIAEDPGAPAHVRRRAIGMAAHLAPSSDVVLGALERIAEDALEPSVVRGGALRSLAKASPARARVLGEALAGDVDPVVARAAAWVR